MSNKTAYEDWKDSQDPDWRPTTERTIATQTLIRVGSVMELHQDGQVLVLEVIAIKDKSGA